MSKNPKVLLVGCLPDSNKLKLFLNYKKCIHNEDSHRLGQQPAVGIQLNTLPFLYKDRLVYLDIWNMTIQFERYRKLAPIYWDNVQAVIGVCSISNALSFYRMQYWLNKFREQNQTLLDVYILVCENYCLAPHINLDFEVSLSMIIKYGCQIQAKIFIIRRHSRGRDMAKFFNDFLYKFWSSGKKTIQIEITDSIMFGSIKDLYLVMI